MQEAVSKVAEALGDTGRILVRESGTEPVVRVMVEAPDHDTCQKYVDEVVNVICEKGYKVCFSLQQFPWKCCSSNEQHQCK